MKDKTKTKKANRSNFLKSRTRPTKDSVIAYELYINSGYNEKQIITTLIEMEAKGIIQSIYSRKKDEDIFFYKPK